MPKIKSFPRPPFKPIVELIPSGHTDLIEPMQSAGQIIDETGSEPVGGTTAPTTTSGGGTSSDGPPL